MTVSQVTGLHKCDDCLQCQEFDQGQFLFVLTQFACLSLAMAPHSSPLIGCPMSSVSPLCDSGWRNLNKIMTGLLCPAAGHTRILFTISFSLSRGQEASGDILYLGTHYSASRYKMKYFCLNLI